MPTIVYCSWATGSDTTGNGSAANPYKTITKASTGLTGGDEVRVAKSPAPTAITAPLTWTDGSTTVVATGADVTGQIAVNDCIGKATAGGNGNPETYWLVASRTYSGGNTTITLAAKYSGSTATAASKKLGVTGTGTGSTGVPFQSVSASGVSEESPLSISGGWNLNTASQDGETWFRQDGASLLGVGLEISSKSFLVVSKLNFARYGTGVVVRWVSSGCVVRNCTAVATGNSYGLYLNSISSSCLFEDSVSAGSTNYGMRVASGAGSIVRRCWLLSNADSGINLGSHYRGDFVDCVVRHNTVNGVSMTTPSNGCKFSRLLVHNSSYGVAVTEAYDVVLLRPVFSSIGTASLFINDTYRTEIPRIVSQGMNNIDGSNGSYYAVGSVVRTDTDGGYHTTAPGVIYTPTSENYIRQEYLLGPVATGQAYTVGVYLKKSAAFNGACLLELYNSDGTLIAGPTAQTLTEDWAQYTMAVSNSAITEANTMVTLRVRVRGTAGTVWLDDLSIA